MFFFYFYCANGSNLILKMLYFEVAIREFEEILKM
jgi:hypothetical protein